MRSEEKQDFHRKRAGMDKTARMRELIPVLREASRAYYQESREIMTNEQYDRLYDELVRLEKETGTVLAGIFLKYDRFAERKNHNQ